MLDDTSVIRADIFIKISKRFVFEENSMLMKHKRYFARRHEENHKIDKVLHSDTMPALGVVNVGSVPVTSQCSTTGVTKDWMCNILSG